MLCAATKSQVGRRHMKTRLQRLLPLIMAVKERLFERTSIIIFDRAPFERMTIFFEWIAPAV